MKGRLWSQGVAVTVVGIVGLATVGLISAVESSPPDKHKWKVALVIYDHVELLDLAGPGEVFAATGDHFKVYTVAATKDPIVSQGFVTIQPEFSIADAPEPDILIVPGGGTRGVLESEAMMDWIAAAGRGAEVSLSVCTGAFILARAGMLDGAEATTFYAATDSLQRHYPDTVVHENVRWVDNGSVVTTAGVSAGIDGSLRVVAKLLGPDAAIETAAYMEYDKWEADDGLVVDTPINREYRAKQETRLEQERYAAIEVPVIDGVQQLTIVIGNNGFEPGSLELRQGVPVRLTFDRQTASSCAAEIKIPDFGIEPRALAMGEQITVEFTPDKSGRYHFACGMDMLRGALLITAS